jgi:hypothetical protein
MRSRTVGLVALALALGPAACARNGTNDPQVASAQTGKPKASASASASAGAGADDPDAPLKFAQCMRSHGISWFPDPNAGKMSIMIPTGQDRAKFEAAQEACKQYMPNGGQRPTPSAEELENARNMAKCMRANGIPNFPDPNPDGGLAIDPKKLGASPDSPLWKKAEAACSQYAPKGQVQQKSGSDSGGGTVVGHAA